MPYQPETEEREDSTSYEDICVLGAGRSATSLAHSDKMESVIENTPPLFNPPNHIPTKP